MTDIVVICAGSKVVCPLAKPNNNLSQCNSVSEPHPQLSFPLRPDLQIMFLSSTVQSAALHIYTRHYGTHASNQLQGLTIPSCKGYYIPIILGNQVYYFRLDP